MEAMHMEQRRALPHTGKLYINFLSYDAVMEICQHHYAQMEFADFFHTFYILLSLWNSVDSQQQYYLQLYYLVN